MGTILTTTITCVVSAVVGGLITFFIARIKGTFNREKALSKGVQCLLRNQIIEYHDKYIYRGYCPIYAKEATRRCYDSYHTLGGNGVVTKLYNDIMALPEEENELPKGNE